MENIARAGRQDPINWGSSILPVHQHARGGCAGHIPLTHCQHACESKATPKPSRARCSCRTHYGHSLELFNAFQNKAGFGASGLWDLQGYLLHLHSTLAHNTTHRIIFHLTYLVLPSCWSRKGPRMQ